MYKPAQIRGHYPLNTGLRCKVTTFFTDIQKGTLIGTMLSHQNNDRETYKVTD